MSIEFRQLRYFVAVAEELHVGRAAQRLHMTQPPLSQAIQGLEALLGVELFIRAKRGITLSAAGHALLPEARRLIKDSLALPELVRSAAQGETGQLSIAFVSSADYNLLPPLLRDFRSHYPQVQISLREATSDVQLEALRLGQIDLGLMIPPIPDKLAEQLNYRAILSEPLILAAPGDAPWLKSKQGAAKLSLADCQGQPLIIFPRKIAPTFYDAILGCFQQAGITPEIGQEAIQMQTIIGLVSAGMGIALVPQSVSNLKRPGVVYYDLVEKTPLVETGLAWRKDNHSPVLHAFTELIRKTK
ncbi:LysR family transcriptional regulator [Sapientia aquatica]|uniref:LysR family transcriptional regulator n=1 Tax=Sapientia aquatica TaxID=1549640 RepID=A0A4V3AV71_9BURK|nr:LysR family transcriptional regulator [Sapientia aquatica]TDK67996.1 LysR family transcriptional regulator [Sapientia aquatica]